MHSNTMVFAEFVRDRMRKGWADGIDPQSAKDIPILIKRIEELERALKPFVSISINESRDNPNSSKPLISCLREDCMHAKDVMDISKSLRPSIQDFGIPAE